MSFKIKDITHKKILFLLSFVFICGIIAGLLIENLWRVNKLNLKENNNSFYYGIESQNLTVSNVSWQEYSSFRKVSFTMDGEFVINVPHNCICLINDIMDNSNLKEVNREMYYVSDGNNLVAYDQVYYKLNNAKIQSEGIVKGEDAIHDAISGYRLVVIFGEDSEVLGYLPPLKDSFLEWSKEENYFTNNDYEIYLDNFKLSKTYSVNTNQSTEDIKLIKKEGSVLDCIIDNTNGNSDWMYNSQLPMIELFYQGAWIEVNSPFDSNLIVSVCCQGEVKEINVPNDTIIQYSYFLPGIYRLVLWGTDGDYIVTDSFVIGYEL